MGIGSQPYGYGPAGQAYPNPSEELRGQLHSSRKIDAARGRYAIADDDSDAIDGMDDVLQTVYLLVSYNVKRQPFISPQHEATTKNAIRKALQPLTKGKAPSIRITKIDVSNDAKQSTWVHVQFKNLLRNTMQSVDL